MTKLIRVSVICCVLIAFLIKPSFCADEKNDVEQTEAPTSIRSYGGNFVVIAPQTEMAAVYAKLAEDIRKLVLNVFGDDTEYKTTTYINLKKHEDKDIGSWNLTALHGVIKKDFENLSISRIEPTLKFCIVYYYLLDVASASAAGNKTIIRGEQIPLWISAAVLENLTSEEREAYRYFINDAVGKNDYLPFEKLFLHKGEFKNEKERALYFHECGSLFDYLASLASGKKRILDSIKELWKKGDLAVCLMRQFEDEFSSVADFENKWLDFVKTRQEKFFDFTRLPDKEVLSRLTDILKVEITTLDKKTIVEKTEQMDFEELSDYKNKTIRLNIALRKIALLQDLKLRASAKFQEMLDEYILSLQSIVEGKKSRFKKHYKKAGLLLQNMNSE